MRRGDSRDDVGGDWSEGHFLDLSRRESKGEAFSCLLARQEKLRGYAWMRWSEEIGGPVQLETLVREATWKAIERLGSYGPEAWSERHGVLGWAFHVGLNHIADRLRQEQGRLEGDSAAVSTGARRELDEQVRAAIAGLLRPQAEILAFDLAHGGLGPSSELAATLEIELGALCQLRREARRALLGLALGSPPPQDWYTLLRRIGRGPGCTRLEAEEAWAELQDAPPRPPPPAESSQAPGSPGQLETAAMATDFLLERARADGSHAWEELYRRYRTMLIVLIQARKRRLADHCFDPEDVLRHAFARAWEKIRSFEYRGEGTFRRWLATVVLNEYHNLVKREQGERLRPLPSGEGELQKAVEKQRLGEEHTWLLEALDKLDEAERDVLIMHEFEGMSFDAIAEILECSRDAVKQTYQRGLERLRRLRGD